MREGSRRLPRPSHRTAWLTTGFAGSCAATYWATSLRASLADYSRGLDCGWRVTPPLMAMIHLGIGAVVAFAVLLALHRLPWARRVLRWPLVAGGLILGVSEAWLPVHGCPDLDIRIRPLR